MKGEIFNLLEAFVVAQFGEVVFERILERSHERLTTREAFVGPGTYPDQDFMTIFLEATLQTGVSAGVAQFEFGRFCFPRLVSKLPKGMIASAGARDFLKSIHEVIHVEVRKIYRDAEPPNFTYAEPDAKTLVMTYRSRRGLFDLVEGLIAGCAEYYFCSIAIARRVLPSEKDIAVCEFTLSF